MSEFSADVADGDRLAKVIARSGLCSRRDAEGWIKDGRVTVNGRKVLTPAFNVTEKDKIKVDGEPLAARQGTRVWLYHKPPGLVVTEKDPEGRETIFEHLSAKGLPRVVSIGRLDINTEGLLLLTNDGGLKRVLELPATGWLRRYRVRAFGTVTQAQLDGLTDGIESEGIQYGPIEAILERTQGSNVWIVMALREGKNREVKNVLGELGLQVNRLIRVSFGPFQLGDLPEGEIETVNARVLRDQLGKRLAELSGADFDSDMPEIVQQKQRAANPKLRAAAPGKDMPKASPRKGADQRFRFEDDDTEQRNKEMLEARPRKDRPGRSDGRPPRPTKELPPDDSRTRKVFFEDGTEKEIKVRPPRAERVRDDPDNRPARDFGRPVNPADRPKRSFGDKGREAAAARARSTEDKPRSFGDKKPYGDKKPFGDKKPYGDKPRGPRTEGSDRPKRAYGDKPYAARPPRDGGDRPGRTFGDKPRSARPAGDGAGRPTRSFGDKKPFAPREGADRPARSFGDKKPFAPRDGGDRPSRSTGDKKPYAPRTDAGDRPARTFGGKPGGARPPREGADRAPRSYGEKPKPYAGKPSTSSRGPKPYSGKPAGARPAGGKPPFGDKPRGPRKPRP